MHTFLAILLFSLQSLTTLAQTTLTPTAPGSYEADGELFASLKKIGDDFDSIQWITQLFTATEIIDAVDKLRSEQNIRVYPLIDFDKADDEFILGLIELYFEKRTNGRPANWIDLKLKLTPLTADLYNFRQYRLNMDLAPAPTLGISSDLVARVNTMINTELNKIQTINGQPAGLVTAIANGLKELLESLRNLGGLKPNADLLRHISIAYYPSATQAYDYDAPGAGLPPVAQYDSYVVNGKTIQVPAKALADAGADPVLVSVRKASTAPSGEVVFRYGNGDAVTITSRADTLWTLSLARPTAGDDEVWAWYLWKDSLDKPRESPLLKLNLGVYGGASQKLVVVPVNGASCPVTKEAIQNVLDDTYGQVAQKWTASIAAKLSVPEWDDNADGKFATNFDNNKPEISFTGDMKSVIKAMKAVGSYDEDTYYIFLIEAPQDRNPAFDGYMPVNSRFGFIFTRETSATTIAKTIAHELGHGAYNLEHTPDPPMGATTNLMDYAPAGLRLHHAQWDNIEDPEWRPLANWGDESEGAYIIDRWKLVRQYIDEFNGKTGTARTNYKFTYDNSKVAENFSTEAINQVNNLLTEYLKENDDPVFVVLELFTHTEEKDVTDIKSIVEQECLDILKEYPETVLIPVIGCQLVNEGNAPIGAVEFYICKKVSEQKINQIGSYDDNWEDLEKENVSEEVAGFLEFLQSSPVFNDEDCLELAYNELGISSASELNPNDVKKWVSEFAVDNGVTIDYSYTGYPMVINSEISTDSPNQPENSNADINIAVHFDDNGKKIIICHHYKAGAIVIPSVTASGDPVQETTVDAIVGLSKVYAAKALANAKAGGEKLQALFNSAVKGVVAAKTWTKTICDKMEVPQTCWNDIDHKQAFDRNPYKIEPVTSGVVDGTFDEIKSIPELITLALDVTFDKEVRNNLWESVKSISWEDIKNFPVKMVKDKASTYSKGGSIAKHEGGKDGVAVASMFFGFGSAKKAKELAETVGKNSTDYAKALQKAYDKIDVSKIDEFGVKLDNLGGGVTGVKLKKLGNTNHTTIAKIDINGNLSFVESEHVFEAVYEIEKKGGAKGYCVLDKADDGKVIFRETSKELGELLSKRKKWINELEVKYGPYNASKNFKPQGLDATEVSESLYKEMLAGYSDDLLPAKKVEYLNGIIKSGSDVPKASVVNAGDELIKIVPKGKEPGFSPFYVKRAEFERLKKSTTIEQDLGLPLNSHSVEYDVYKATAKKDVKVFESTVAPTMESGYKTTGGATQSLILDIDNWNLTPIEPLIPAR